MPHQAKITITGLGAGAPGDITLSTWEALKTSPCILLRTGRHPVVKWLHREGICFSTFDHFYEEACGFQEVYARIAETVLDMARREPVLYAVPGHPLVAEDSVRLIIEKAEQEAMSVKLLSAVSFLDALFSALRFDPVAGVQLVDGLRLDEGPPLGTRAAVITQVYSRSVASDVKLALLEVYPPEHLVTVVRGAGIPDEERIETVPLFELDRLTWIDHLTSVYIPTVSSQLSVVGSCRKNKAGDIQDRMEIGYGAKDEAAPENLETKDEAEVAGRGQAVGEPESVNRLSEVEAVRLDGGKVFDSCTNSVMGAQSESEGCDCDRTCRFPLDPLVEILAQLRGENGCPWDREQDHRTLRPYLLEETYEVLEALDEENMYNICEELGDLLLQIVFHAQIAAENEKFDMNDVIAGITEKMIRRHPHVFGAVTVKDSNEVSLNWEKIKAKERDGSRPQGLLSGISHSLPVLMRAVKLQEKAAGVGFDWPDYRGALEKTHEELDELESVISDGDKVQIEEELGDLIFSVVNLARLLGVEPEAALVGTSGKFERRFSYVEKMAGQAGKELLKCTLSELDMWWEEAKKQEKI